MSLTRIKEIVFHARNLERSARASFLEEACEGDAHLRREVESLLAFESVQQEAAEESSTVVLPAPARGEYASEPAPGDHVGGYTLRRKLGEGGMGVVFEAWQEATQRVVALKLIHAGWLDAGRVRHFRHEIEALGRLHHPGIATIYDAGVSHDGRPYYAMELVPGRTLDALPADWLDGDYSRSALRRPLEIVIGICDAVDHAHRQGVTHRDLKPQNIMLVSRFEPTETTATPEIRILDFGLARIARPDGSATLTEAVAIKGTLPYMSPEQARGIASEIDYRSDLFSIGVIAYRLLTGVHPYHVPTASLAEALRAVVEAEPQDAREVRPRCPRELAALLRKALAKERDQRYQSAKELADDLRRFLRSEPLSVSRRSWSQRLLGSVTGLRQVRTPAMAALALVGAGLAALLMISLRGGGWALASPLLILAGLGAWIVRLRRGLRVAERKAEQTRTFFEEMLLAPHPEARGRTATVLEAIERARPRLNEALGEFPDVEGALRASIGTVYAGLREDEAASEELSQAIERLSQAHGPDSLELERAETQFVHVHLRRLRFAEAEALVRRLHLRSSRARGEENPATVNILGNLAVILGQQGRVREALPLYRRALAARERARGPESTAAVLATQALGNALRRTGAYEEAEVTLRRALAYQQSAEWAERNRAQTMLYLSAVLAQSGSEWDESEWLARRALRFYREQPGAEVGPFLGAGAGVLRALGRFAEALEVIDEALERCRQGPAGDGHPFVSDLWFTRGGVLSDLGKHPEGVETIERGLRNLERGSENWEGVAAVGFLEHGVALSRLRSFRIADLSLESAERAAAQALGARHPIVRWSGLQRVLNRLWSDEPGAAAVELDRVKASEAWSGASAGEREAWQLLHLWTTQPEDRRDARFCERARALVQARDLRVGLARDLRVSLVGGEQESPEQTAEREGVSRNEG